MKALSSSIKILCWSALLLLLSTTLSSYSANPQPPVEKKSTTQEQRREQRLHKRYHKLHERMEQTTNTKQRHRLQKRIRQVAQQQAVNPVLVLSLFSLLVGILSFLLLIYTGLAPFTASGSQFLTAAVRPWVSFGMAFSSLGTAILALYFGQKKPARGSFGMAVTGSIFGSLVLLVFLLILIFRSI